MIELAGLAGALMLLGCFVPRSKLPAKLPHDSILHITAFALMTLPLCTLARNSLQLLGLCAALWVFGLLIECIQHYIPQRRFGADDLLYNAAGIALVGVPWGFLLNR